MSNISAHKTSHFLRTGSESLRLIATKIKQLTLLNQQIKPCLDTAIVDYCEVANCIGNKIILLVANGSIATMLRLQIPEILEKCRQIPTLKHIKQVQVKVKVMRDIAPDYHRPPLQPLSEETANLIKECANNLQDERLKKIMQRISERTLKTHP